MDPGEPTEQSPLLIQSSTHSRPVGTTNNHDAPPANPDTSSQKDGFPIRNMVLAALIVLIFAVFEASGMLQNTPLNQVLEDNICRQMHPKLSQDIDCGTDKAVQAELALVAGWKATFDLLPGIFTAVPYGFMADKYGTKPILFACLVGISLNAGFMAAVLFWPSTFPTRLVWATSMFMFIGGGLAVLSSIIYSTLARLVPESHRATAFLAMSAIIMSLDMALNTLASVLMTTGGPWLPVAIGLCLQPLGLLLGLTLPEVRNMPVSPGAAASAAADETTMPPDLRQHDDEAPSPVESGKKGLVSRLRHSASQLATAAWIFICGDYRVALLLVTFPTTALGKMAQTVMLQYAHNRFRWTWAQVGYIATYKAAVVVVLLLVLLPGTNYILTNLLSMQPKRKDFLVARGSATLLTGGMLLIGLAASRQIFILGLTIFGLGSGYGIVLKSLLTQMIEPHHQATLFTIIAVVDEIGSLISGPLLAVLYRVSLSLEDVWMGLPYLLSAGLSSTAVIITHVVRI